MSAVNDLLYCLAKVGAKLEPSGDRLIVRTGANSVPGELVQRLRDAKAEVLAALAARDASVRDRNADDRTQWRDKYSARIVHWFRGGRPWQEAERLAFGEMILEWHRRHGARPDPSRCAGCGDDLPDNDGLVVDRDGTRVHLDDVRGVDCITAHGSRWRRDAVAGLQAVGLYSPEGFEVL